MVHWVKCFLYEPELRWQCPGEKRNIPMHSVTSVWGASVETGRLLGLAGKLCTLGSARGRCLVSSWDLCMNLDTQVCTSYDSYTTQQWNRMSWVGVGWSGELSLGAVHFVSWDRASLWLWLAGQRSRDPPGSPSLVLGYKYAPLPSFLCGCRGQTQALICTASAVLSGSPFPIVLCF